jgi:hypothetical protein
VSKRSLHKQLALAQYLESCTSELNSGIAGLSLVGVLPNVDADIVKNPVCGDGNTNQYGQFAEDGGCGKPIAGTSPVTYDYDDGSCTLYVSQCSKPQHHRYDADHSCGYYSGGFVASTIPSTVVDMDDSCGMKLQPTEPGATNGNPDMTDDSCNKLVGPAWLDTDDTHDAWMG